MTMKLPQMAGFVPTTAEWDQLVRIAENLAAQVVQAQASAVETARIVGAERDAARAEVMKLRSDLSLARDEYSAADYDAHKWATLANEKANALEDARAEVARLTAARIHLAELWRDFLNNRDSIPAGLALRDETIRVLADALRKPAPAQGQE